MPESSDGRDSFVGVNETESDDDAILPGWARTPRGIRELGGVGLFCIAAVVIPLVRTELYPFSSAPMFSAAPRRYCNYRVLDPEGRELSVADFGLQRNYWGNPPEVGVGFRPSESLDRFGEVADHNAVIAQVTSKLKDFPSLEAVEVVQEVIGPVDSDRIGLVSAAHWVVKNPRRSARGPR